VQPQPVAIPAESNDPAQETTAAAITAAPTTMEEINAVVQPLVQSAEGALSNAGTTLLDFGASALLTVTYLASPGTTATHTFATIMSGLPSPFTSATATEVAAYPPEL
jgi:hypothetical protein